jgi:L-lactate dehydrogenase
MIGLSQKLREVDAMKQKIVIIGAGSVGATYAYALMHSGNAREIVLVDANHERALGEAMDLQQGGAFTRPVEISAGDYRECGNADIVLITAGAKQRPGENRLDLLRRNALIIRDIVSKIREQGFHGILLVVSNPVDVLTHVAWQASGLPRSRVIGSGTVLDSSRLRVLLAQHCRVDARNVHAFIIGEHGDSEVAAWSAATVGGIPLEKYCADCNTCAGKERYPALLEAVKRSAYEIINRKGATYYAIGLALVQITDAIVRDEHRVLPVSSVHSSLFGISDLPLSLPAIVGREGIERVLTLPLNAAESEALKNSANVIKNSLESLSAMS